MQCGTAQSAPGSTSRSRWFGLAIQFRANKTQATVTRQTRIRLASQCNVRVVST